MSNGREGEVCGLPGLGAECEGGVVDGCAFERVFGEVLG